MLTALDAPDSMLDESERSFVANIREHGWFGTHIFAEGGMPGFSFTTGFWVTRGQPEIILFGMKSQTAHDIFWNIYRDLKAGRPLPVAERNDEIFATTSAYFLEVQKSHYHELLGWSRWFYGNDDFPTLQLVWPDRANLFPWQPEFDPAMKASQPDLSEGWDRLAN